MGKSDRYRLSKRNKLHEKKENKENGFLKKPENGGIFMKKRVLSLLLCTAMTIGALSGCGKDAGKDEGKTTEVLGNDAGDEIDRSKNLARWG